MPKKSAKQTKVRISKFIVLSGQAALVLIIVSLSTLNIHSFFLSQKVLAASVQVEHSPDQLKQEMKYWQKIAVAHPTYRDAYLEMADIANKLGETQASIEFLKKANFVDPH